MRRNAIWFCRLRWIVAGLLAAVGLAGLFPEELSRWGLRLEPGWPLVTAAALIALNVVYLVRLPRSVDDRSAAALRVNVWVQVIADLIVLTVVIHFAGSLETYALFMYLFHIIFACIFFRHLPALAVAVGAAALYLACLTVEAVGWAPPETVLMHSGVLDRSQLAPQFWILHTGSAFLIWGVIWYLASRLAGDLRRREREVAWANFRLKAGIDERARHMLQTTHQLKAPFAAIHANAQLLLGGYCGELPEAATGVVEKIAARCAVLSQQIIDMLQLANLRSEVGSPSAQHDVELGRLIEASIARIEPAASGRGIRLQAELQPVQVLAVEDHVRMLLDNLLTNAVHYSHEGGTVEVSCSCGPDGSAQVAVRDQGIGIEADKLPRIFEDYFRTREALAHNKASTGLGLAIVRGVARAAGVAVEVQSAPGHGTQFRVTIPRTPPDRLPPTSEQEFSLWRTF